VHLEENVLPSNLQYTSGRLTLILSCCGRASFFDLLHIAGIYLGGWCILACLLLTLFSLEFPEGPILGTPFYWFERNYIFVRYNRRVGFDMLSEPVFITCLIDTGTNKRHSNSMATPTRHTTLASLLDQFTREMDKSPLTIQAYRTDIQQFITWLSENDLTTTRANQVTRSHIDEYLKYLANKGHTGTTRSRKLNSLHMFFTYLVREGVILLSPAATVKRPRRERKPKHTLRPDEYYRVVAAARGNPRDIAILQLMLQTGIRVSELIAIREPDLDLEQKTLTILNKGSKKRILYLEKKALQALKSYLLVRPKTSDEHLFLNYRGEGFSIGGVRKTVEKYLKRAGITKKIGCHSLHYTCITNRAALGMNAFYLKTPLRHKRMRTSTKYMSIGIEELRKLMEFTSL
jgi:site-specific recombinase XerD